MKSVLTDPRYQKAVDLLAEIAQERRGEINASATDTLQTFGTDHDFCSFVLSVHVEYAPLPHEIAKLRDRVPDNWALCEFTGDCESETMLAQTIHASVANHVTHGLLASFYSHSLEEVSGGGLANNPRGIAKLLDRKLLELKKVDLSLLRTPPPKTAKKEKGCVWMLSLTRKGVTEITDHLDKRDAKKKTTGVKVT